MNLDGETESQTGIHQNLQQTLVLKQSFQIEYAVFFNHITASNCQRSRIAPGFCDHRLIPLPRGGKRSGCYGGCPSGAWLCSSSCAASLFLFSYTPNSPLVLLISLNGKIHEEHFVSKLHLSWPQMSCGTLRGSRVVVASYKDSVGQIQKFAMRFLNSSQSQLFIDSLKESMKDVGNIGPPSSGYLSEVPSENQFIHSDEVYCSAAAELNPAHTASNDTLLVQSSGGHGAECAFNEETSAPDEKSTDRNLPPSFPAFVANRSTKGCKDATEPVKVPLDADLFSHQAKHLPGSSFNAMLGELEKFIHNLEGDLAFKV